MEHLLWKKYVVQLAAKREEGRGEGGKGRRRKGGEGG